MIPIAITINAESASKIANKVNQAHIDLVRESRKFMIACGVISKKIKVAAKAGLHSAIITYGSDQGLPYDIDLMNIMNNDLTTLGYKLVGKKSIGGWEIRW